MTLSARIEIYSAINGIDLTATGDDAGNGG